MSLHDDQITEKQILPIFKVISQLEKPDFSDTSLWCDQQQFYGDELLNDSIICIGDIHSTSDKNGQGVMINREGKQIKKEKKTNRKSKIQPNFGKMQRNMTDGLPEPNIGRKTYSANFISTKSGLYSKPQKGPRAFLDDHDSRTEKFKVDGSQWIEEPLYEEPRDLLQTKPTKTTLKRHKHKHVRGKLSSLMAADKNYNLSEIQSDSKIKLEKLKQRLSAKYEDLISKLVDKCQENDLKLSEKQSQIDKLMEKLKLLRQYNNQFGDENNQLRQQQEELGNILINYKEQITLFQEQINNTPDQDMNEEYSADQQIRQSCCNCLASEGSITVLNNANSKLRQDVLMLKNVVYRLNVQLSRYQEKLGESQAALSQNTAQTQLKHVLRKNDLETTVCCVEQIDRELPSLPSLPLASHSMSNIMIDDQQKSNQSSDQADDVGLKSVNLQNVPNDNVEENSYSASSKKIQPKRNIAWGDVNSHTLAPLLNAYQDSATEREQLIHDYEKNFNRFTLKIKDIIKENNRTYDKLEQMTERAVSAEAKLKILLKEKVNLTEEADKLKERCRNSEEKINEFQEIYEQKIAVMARDYEVLHREYFEMKTRLAALDVQTEQSGRRDKEMEEEYERKVAECKRLFEDLKRKYSEEKECMERKNSDLERDRTNAFEKMSIALAQSERLKLDVKKLKKDLRLSKRVCGMLRLRLSAAKTSVDSYKRKWRQTKNAVKNLNYTGDGAAEVPTDREMQLANTLEKIREDMKVVQKSAYKQLEAVDRRIKDQERYIVSLQSKHASEIQKANILVEQKELMIENLLDKMSGYENIRDSRAGPQQTITSSPKVLKEVALQTDPLAEINDPVIRGSYSLIRDREKIMSRQNF